jgi:quercetin dioxygenase-like cupin family protein
MSETEERAIFRGPGEGKSVPNPAGGPLAYKARGEETRGALTFWESIAAPGEGPPLHLHIKDDEFMYVVEGHFRFRLEEEVHQGPPGSFVFVPHGLPHTWQNAGDAPARLLFGFAPAAPHMERFFERAAELSDETRMAEGFGRFAEDAGMEIVGPPLAQTHPHA